MKIDFKQEWKDLDGSPIKDAKGENLTFSKQIGNVIFQSQEKENPMRYYELAKKIYYSEGEIDYETSEIEIIKAKIKDSFIAGFSGQALELIAKADMPTKKDSVQTLEDPIPPVGGGGGSPIPVPPTE